MIELLLFFTSIMITLLVKKVALLDHPNERSAHSVATPTGGGMAIVLSFYLGLGYLFFRGEIESSLFYALLSGGILVLVSFVDDYRPLSPALRLFAQFVSIIMALYFLDLLKQMPWYATAVVILAMIWLVNLYNFLDGIDGYAGSEAIVVALGASLFYHDRLFIMMALSVAGFLLFNWHKASIFMGDVGSTFLGFFFGVMALYHYHDSADVIIWFVLLGLFIVDATVTLFRRFLRGEKLSIAHKKHAFQRLVQSGFSHQKVVLLAMGFNLLCLLFLYFAKEKGFLLTSLLCYTLGLWAILAWIEKRKGFDV